MGRATAASLPPVKVPVIITVSSLHLTGHFLRTNLFSEMYNVLIILIKYEH